MDTAIPEGMDTAIPEGKDTAIPEGMIGICTHSPSTGGRCCIPSQWTDGCTGAGSLEVRGRWPVLSAETVPL